MGADIVTYDISTYQRRLTAMPFFPGTSYTLAILGANGVTDKFFLAFLFNNIDVGVQGCEYSPRQHRVL